MIASSKNVLFPDHNHLLTTGTDDPSLTDTQAIIKVSDHQYKRFTSGPGNRTFLEVASMVVTWLIEFLCSEFYFVSTLIDNKLHFTIFVILLERLIQTVVHVLLKEFKLGSSSLDDVNLNYVGQMRLDKYCRDPSILYE